MKIAIIGPGALGCLLAASLTIKLDQSRDIYSALDLWLLDYKPDRAQYLNDNGLILEEGNRKITCPIKATVDPREIGQQLTRERSARRISLYSVSNRRRSNRRR
jgi:ketopantoate reductase